MMQGYADALKRHQTTGKSNPFWDMVDTVIPKPGDRDKEEASPTKTAELGETTIGPATDLPKADMGPSINPSRSIGPSIGPSRIATAEPEKDGSDPVAASARALSRMGETGKTGKAALASINKNDTKNTSSYGTWGLNTGSGSIHQFVKEHPEFGLNAQPGSPEFDKQWRTAAFTDDKGDFQKAHDDWHQKNIMSGLPESLTKKGVDPRIASNPAVQTYMADRKLQMGTAGLDTALARAQGASTPQEFLSAVSQTDKERLPANFRSYLRTHPNDMPGLSNRIDLRHNTSLSLADPESTAKLVSYHRGETPTVGADTSGAVPTGTGSTVPPASGIPPAPIPSVSVPGASAATGSPPIRTAQSIQPGNLKDQWQAYYSRMVRAGVDPREASEHADRVFKSQIDLAPKYGEPNELGQGLVTKPMEPPAPYMVPGMLGKVSPFGAKGPLKEQLYVGPDGKLHQGILPPEFGAPATKSPMAPVVAPAATARPPVTAPPAVPSVAPPPVSRSDAAPILSNEENLREYIKNNIRNGGVEPDAYQKIMNNTKGISFDRVHEIIKDEVSKQSTGPKPFNQVPTPVPGPGGMLSAPAPGSIPETNIPDPETSYRLASNIIMAPSRPVTRQQMAQAEELASSPTGGDNGDWKRYVEEANARPRIGSSYDSPDIIELARRAGAGDRKAQNDLINMENLDKAALAKAEKVDDKTATENHEISKSISEGGAQAIKLQQSLKLARRSLDSKDFTAGPFAGSVTAFRNAKQQLQHIVDDFKDKNGNLEYPGISDWLKGLDIKSPAANQIYGKIISGSVLQSLRNMLGPNAGQFRVQELKLLEQAFGNENLSPEGNKVVMSIIDRLNDRAILTNRMANMYRTEHGGTIDSNFNDMLDRYSEDHPAIKADDYDDILHIIKTGSPSGSTPSETAPVPTVTSPAAPSGVKTLPGGIRIYPRGQ